MSPRHRAAHRRPGRRHYQPILAAVGSLIAVAAGIALGDHFGPAVAARPDGATFADGADSPAPWTTADQGAPPSTGSQSPVAAPDGASSVVALDIPFPHSGPGTVGYATTTGPVLGESGPIKRFRVAMESNISVVSIADFTAKVDATLGDPRSWIAGDTYRLQQVPRSSAADFTIYLVTASTTNKMCAPLPTNSFTSCRQGSHVVLNLDRYMTSVSAYRNAKVSLDIYRTYMINHEVGHALGHGHQLCPSNGAPAPVMEQQTLGLHGCTPNPWPYIDGKLYAGPSGSY
jgi:hypothetical protein